MLFNAAKRYEIHREKFDGENNNYKFTLGSAILLKDIWHSQIYDYIFNTEPSLIETVKKWPPNIAFLVL